MPRPALANLRLPEEVAFFGRSGLFGVALAVVYWFLSYEIVGTVLLGGFGIATGAAALVLRHGLAPDRQPGTADRQPGTAAAEQPFEDEGGRVPLSSAAPLGVGFGIGLASLGLAYGIWFVLAGLLPFGLGVADWLASAMREAEADA